MYNNSKLDVEDIILDNVGKQITKFSLSGQVVNIQKNGNKIRVVEQLALMIRSSKQSIKNHI